jgi:hypothetical protein
MNLEEFKKLDHEEQRAQLFDKMSDAVRSMAEKLMMMKAIAKNEHDLAPEDFDKALERELKKEWDKVKDKDSHQLAIIGLLDIISDGGDPEKILEEVL